MGKIYWLVKSEPNAYSIDNLVKDKKTHWDGVRNYQARNFMRDDMKKGDHVLFYHSNAEPTAVVGICEVVKEGQWKTIGSYPLAGGRIVHLAALYRKQYKIIEYDEQIHLKGQCADWDRWKRIQESGAKIGFLDKVIGKHYLEGVYRGFAICT